jgi:hypothetical protein
MISVKRGKDTGLGRNLQDRARVMMAAVVYVNLDWYEVVEIMPLSLDVVI